MVRCGVFRTCAQLATPAVVVRPVRVSSRARLSPIPASSPSFFSSSSLCPSSQPQPPAQPRAQPQAAVASPEYDPYDPSLDQRFLPRLVREIKVSLGRLQEKDHVESEQIHQLAPQANATQSFFRIPFRRRQRLRRVRQPLTRRQLHFIASCAAAALLFILLNTEYSRESGRWRYDCFSHDRPLYDDPAATMFRVLKSFGGELLPISDPRYERVQRVVDKLIADSDMRDVPFSVRVVENSTTRPIALLAPPETIYVWSRFLDDYRDDDMLAGVLAHELAHWKMRHANENVSLFVTALALVPAAVIFRKALPLSLPWTLVIGAMSFWDLFSLPLSRRCETEADYLGLLMMAAAGYDPRKVPKFWESIIVKYNIPDLPGAIARIGARHPPPRQRIANLEGWMPEAIKVREQSAHRFREKTRAGDTSAHNFA